MEKWIAFFRAHERALIIIALGLLIWLGWRKYISHRDAADHDLAVVAAAKVDADKQTAQTANQQVQQLQSQVNQLATANNQLRTEVMNAIANRQQQTDQRKQNEQTAPLADVAGRWATLIGADSNAVRADAGGGTAVTDSATRATVQKLEDGSAAEANYGDLQRLDAGKDAQIEGLNKLVESETASAKAQTVLLADQVQQCKTDLKVSSDEGKKKGRRGFWRGLAVGAGAVAAIAIRFI